MLVRPFYSKDSWEVYARPAAYNERMGLARVFLYIGRLAPNNRPQMRARAGGEETVFGVTLNVGKYYSVEPFETGLDVTPLRELPLWAKDMWARTMEMLPPEGNDEYVARTARLVAMMNTLIKREREGDGFDPEDFSKETQGRYLKLWFSTEAVGKMTEGQLKEEELGKMLHHLETVREALPLMNELPWWRGGILDPGDRFDWQGAYEELVLLLVQVTKSLEDVVRKMMDEERKGENGSV